VPQEFREGATVSHLGKFTKVTQRTTFEISSKIGTASGDGPNYTWVEGELHQMFRLIAMISIIVLTATVNRSALACLIAPPQAFKPPYELIRNSQNIVLASMTGYEIRGSSTIFGFEVVERLSGELPGNFEIEFDQYPPEGLEPGISNEETFDDHRDYRFWIEDIARTYYTPDCRITPTFEAGGTYLIFADLPYTIRSFEKIDRLDDLWLSVVRRTIVDNRRPGQAVFSLEEFVRQFDTIYLAKCPELGGTTWRITILETLRGLSRETLSRSQFTPRFRRRCSGTGLEFLYLSDAKEESVVVAPVFGGVADFRDVAPGLSIVPFGQATVEEVANIAQAPVRKLR